MSDYRCTRERACACGGTYADTGKGWAVHSRTTAHRVHEARFDAAGQVPVNEPAVFRGYPRTGTGTEQGPSA